MKCVIEIVHKMMKLAFSWLKDKYIYFNLTFIFLSKQKQKQQQKFENATASSPSSYEIKTCISNLVRPSRLWNNV
jgi:hypothetical protein